MIHCCRVPTRTGKPEKWEGIFQSGKNQGILTRLEKSGKITQNSGELREFQILCYSLVTAKLICALFAKFAKVLVKKGSLKKLLE